MDVFVILSCMDVRDECKKKTGCQRIITFKLVLEDFESSLDSKEIDQSMAEIDPKYSLEGYC